MWRRYRFVVSDHLSLSAQKRYIGLKQLLTVYPLAVMAKVVVSPGKGDELGNLYIRVTSGSNGLPD